MFYGFSTGVVGIVVLIVLVLLLTGRLSSSGRPHGHARFQTTATLALPPSSFSMTARSAIAVTE
ncbi:MAG: hypothetical protein HY699_03995 [Deltaproteobacteria bacterium]|nr:hypothetical protein [Deltaproteobacteria bacterium]